MLKSKKIAYAFVLCALLCMVLPFVEKKQSNAGTAPVITIESYELSQGDFSPGKESTIRLKLKNNSKKYDADSVVITLSSVDMMISPVYGTSNQIMVDKITSGGEVTVEFAVDVPSEIEIEKATVAFNISYGVITLSKDRQTGYETYSNEATISIPITYDQSFTVTNVSVADTANVGTTTLVSLSYSNNDVDDVTEIELEMEGNIDETTSKVEIGDLMAGQTGVKDTYVKFTEAGTQTLKMTISYKDSSGRAIKKDVGTFTVEVAESVIANNQSDVTVEEDSSASKLKMALLAIGILLVVACVVMYTYRKNRE